MLQSKLCNKKICKFVYMTYGQDYSEFLGLQNTGFGQWVNRTFSKKKRMQQEYEAQQNLLDFQQQNAYSPYVSTVPVDMNAALADVRTGNVAPQTIVSNFQPQGTLPDNTNKPVADNTPNPPKSNAAAIAMVGGAVIILVGIVSYFAYKNKKGKK